MNPRLFAEPPPAHLICRVCRGVYREPRVNQCGHTLCSGCYGRLLPDGQPQLVGACPQCGSSLVAESSVPNRDISEEVEELAVHCIYHFQLTPSQRAQAQFLPPGLELTASPTGCDAKVPLVELDRHISDCAHRPVPCPFDTVNCQGCSQRDLQQHTQDCIFRFLKCPPRELLDGLSARQSVTLATLASLEEQLRSIESRLGDSLDRLDAASAASAMPTPRVHQPAAPAVPTPTTARAAAPAAAALSISRGTLRTASTRSAMSAAVAGAESRTSQRTRAARGGNVFDFGAGDRGGGGGGIEFGGGSQLERSPSLPVGAARVNGLPASQRSYLTCVADLTWHSSRVLSLLLIPDQFQLVSLDSTGAIVAWNIEQLCSGHAGNARAVERLSSAVCADSFVCACRVPGADSGKFGKYVFVGCRDGSLLQLARFVRDINRVKNQPAAHSACVTAVTASPGGLLFSGSRGELKVWICSNLRHLQTVPVTPGQTVRCLAFDAWRGALLCACETELHRFLVRQQPPHLQPPQQQPPLQPDLPSWHQRFSHQLLADIACMAVTEDRILLGTGVPEHSLWLFCAVTGRPLACLAGGAGLSCVACVQDGDFAIAGCQNGSLQVWQLLNPRRQSLGGGAAVDAGALLRQQTDRHRDSVTSISLLRDLLFTGSGDGWMKVFRFHP